MAKELNIDGSNYDQTFSQIIDNILYIFHIYYNKRSGWYLSVYDSDLYNEDSDDNTEALIYGGRKLMPNQSLFKMVSDDRLPTGALFCVDTDLKDITDKGQVVIDNFGIGKRYRLVYFPLSELV